MFHFFDITYKDSKRYTRDLVFLAFTCVIVAT